MCDRMGRSTRCCYLCGAAQFSDKFTVTLHGFPKDDATRSLWMRVCNVNKYCDITQMKICSDHFTEQDYRNPNAHVYGGVLKLKNGAVPSVEVPKPIKTEPLEPVEDPCTSTLQIHSVFLPENSEDCMNIDDEVVPKIEIPDISQQNNLSTTELCTHEKQKFSEPLYINEIINLDLGSSRQTNKCIILVNTAACLPDTSDSDPLLSLQDTCISTHSALLSKSPIERKNIVDEVDNTIEIQDSSQQDNCSSTAELCKPGKRKFAQPRFVNDITDLHLATPKEAKSCILLAKTTLQKKKVKIRTLHQQIRRLKKKNASLEKEIAYLKEKSDLTAET